MGYREYKVEKCDILAGTANTWNVYNAIVAKCNNIIQLYRCRTSCYEIKNGYDVLESNDKVISVLIYNDNSSYIVVLSLESKNKQGERAVYKMKYLCFDVEDRASNTEAKKRWTIEAEVGGPSTALFLSTTLIRPFIIITAINSGTTI